MRILIYFVLVAVVFAGFVKASSAKTEVSRKSGGKLPDGALVDAYTLKDEKLEVQIINYGGTVISIKAPDRNGKIEDLVLGFDDAAGYYENNHSKSASFFGPIVGRYANRIAGGKFTLDGKEYTLAKNNNGVTVRYTLTGGDLKIEYRATTDKPTVLNLTNHSYFNLSGQGHGTILQDQLKLNASQFTPVDANMIPTGELKPVEGTPFDFQKAHVIGERINTDNEQIRLGHGYDHNFVIDGGGHTLTVAAEAFDPNSGRVLEVLTTEPGVQLYTSNFLDGSIKGKQGIPYIKNGAFCLETQHFPDSPNHPNFPSTVLGPSAEFQSVTIYRFSTR
jgi:aldose 1-epimerase